MTEHVSITIVKVTEPDAPGLDLTYAVTNVSEKPVWLVDDDDLVWNREGDEIELSFARATLDESVEPFGYFDPAVRKLHPEETIEKEIRLRWPHRVNTLWNDSSKIDPEPGSYTVRVRVGYGLEPEPDSPALGEPIDDGVLRWQHEAVSDSITVRIPASE